MPAPRPELLRGRKIVEGIVALDGPAFHGQEHSLVRSPPRKPVIHLRRPQEDVIAIPSAIPVLQSLRECIEDLLHVRGRAVVLGHDACAVDGDVKEVRFVGIESAAMTVQQPTVNEDLRGKHPLATLNGTVIKAWQVVHKDLDLHRTGSRGCQPQQEGIGCRLVGFQVPSGVSSQLQPGLVTVRFGHVTEDGAVTVVHEARPRGPRVAFNQR
mmetsp:Transcript_38154/g.91655  ORF Transcript_38154/g.91655 Transcript_38154/m.91655 type:complete len:212 (+) Transcript_38154:989-1624(+)